MPLTKEEFEEAVRLICPYCRDGAALKYREATKEWVHDYVAVKGGSGHSICWANGLRNSRFAEEVK